MDVLRGMGVFVKVVDSGSFSAAAQALNISKSAVSKQMAALEERLDARLINRTTRRLSLTEVGTAFYQRCRRILDEIEEAEVAVNRMHAEPRGTLRVNVPVAFGVLHVAPALPDFLQRFPDLTIEVELNDRRVDLIEEGIDVAIRMTRMPDSSLITRRLAPVRRVLCATPEYWEAHGIPQRPDDLQYHNCLNYIHLLDQDRLPFQGPDGPISVRVSGNLYANTGDVLKPSVLAGIGCGLLPTFIVGEELKSGLLQGVLTEYEETDASIYAVYPHKRHLSAKVRAFVDFLAERFGPKPYWEP